ncbi:MAG: hypothetical protein PF486_12400 [Prolixibacteraceae bacterium]|jgi:hypothetical protein|nr:hypothetical protein [Prolixibacteraceae bacterium]
MKKSLLTLASLFIFLAVFTTSCDPDESSTNEILDEFGNVIENGDGENPDQLSGSYEVYINESVVAEGTTEEVGLVQNDLGSYYTTVTLSEGRNLTILVSGFSRETGGVTEIEGTDVSVTIGGFDILKTDGIEEFIIAEEGTVKRDSKEKISFEGTCKDIIGTEIMSLSGYIESEAFKVIQ